MENGTVKKGGGSSRFIYSLERDLLVHLATASVRPAVGVTPRGRWGRLNPLGSGRAGRHAIPVALFRARGLVSQTSGMEQIGQDSEIYVVSVLIRFSRIFFYNLYKTCRQTI